MKSKEAMHGFRCGNHGLATPVKQRWRIETDCMIKTGNSVLNARMEFLGLQVKWIADPPGVVSWCEPHSVIVNQIERE